MRLANSYFHLLCAGDVGLFSSRGFVLSNRYYSRLLFVVRVMNYKRKETIGNATLYLGDCMEVMPLLDKVDAVVTDPPYGTTACKWDNVIPFNLMWENCEKLRQEKTPVILFGSEPFSSSLRMHNIKNYKYDWIWNKKLAGNGILEKNNH